MIATISSAKELIDEMRKVKELFGRFARCEHFLTGLDGEVFQRELIRSYYAFVHAIDIVIDHYNETEPNKMQLFDEPREVIP